MEERTETVCNWSVHLHNGDHLCTWSKWSPVSHSVRRVCTSALSIHWVLMLADSLTERTCSVCVCTHTALQLVVKHHSCMRLTVVSAVLNGPDLKIIQFGRRRRWIVLCFILIWKYGQLLSPQLYLFRVSVREHNSLWCGGLASLKWSFSLSGLPNHWSFFFFLLLSYFC